MDNNILIPLQRQYDPTTWRQNLPKAARCQGRSFVGKRGNVTDKRRMGPTCIRPYCRQVRHKCAELSERERSAIFLTFWSFATWALRYSYVQTLTDNTAQGPQRNHYQWHLKTNNGRRYPVCRSMVASTIGVAERTLVSWLKKKAGPKGDKAPKTGKTARIHTFTENFIEEIPTVPSHYCRSAESYANKNFFEPDTTEEGLHREYQRRAREADHRELSVASFSKKLRELNYSVFKPKKDQCNLFGSQTWKR